MISLFLYSKGKQEEYIWKASLMRWIRQGSEKPNRISLKEKKISLVGSERILHLQVDGEVIGEMAKTFWHI